MKLRLKDFRQAHNLFQSDMADILGINQSNASRSELTGFIALTLPQQQALYDKFGKEDVDAYTFEGGMELHATNNTNQGDGTQNNGCFLTDNTTLDIIKQQSEALTALATKQTEQMDRLLTLLEKLSERL